MYNLGYYLTFYDYFRAYFILISHTQTRNFSTAVGGF